MNCLGGCHKDVGEFLYLSPCLALRGEVIDVLLARYSGPATKSPIQIVGVNTISEEHRSYSKKEGLTDASLLGSN